ncbi:frataxin, mitochondrial [Anabrus simplex]|uniref:frataxin, mitochondrial n=1 Tax=Anabrus simplex TaxID=316456 RepID=UPI0035A3C8C2
MMEVVRVLSRRTPCKISSSSNVRQYFRIGHYDKIIGRTVNNVSNKLFLCPKNVGAQTLTSNLVRSLTFLSSRHNSTITGPLNSVTFDQVCDETLDSLSEYFEELIESCNHLESADVTYGDGVLTVQFGKPYGTYVINRQTPNQQIWLSSPISGPKRYDFQNGKWIYRHDGISLHDLLSKEVADIVKQKVDFSCCSYSGKN